MKKILVIEDEKILLDVLQKKLIQEGYDVAIAEDGEEGVRKMRQVEPDLVLLDMMMPKKDGYEVLTDISQDEKLKTIPVIIISNSGQPVEIDRALALGAKDYLIKADFGIDEVIEKVKKLFGESETGVARNKEAVYKKNDKLKEKKVIPSGEKILIVEDDHFLRELISKKMEKEGFEVTEASDGEEAFRKIEKNRPSLILLDLILPGIHGFEILRKIKEENSTKGIPVIILTNLGQRDEVEQGINLGAEDFLVKAHHTIDEIIDKVRKVLKDQKNKK